MSVKKSVALLFEYDTLYLSIGLYDPNSGGILDRANGWNRYSESSRYATQTLGGHAHGGHVSAVGDVVFSPGVPAGIALSGRLFWSGTASRARIRSSQDRPRPTVKTDDRGVESQSRRRQRDSGSRR